MFGMALQRRRVVRSWRGRRARLVFAVLLVALASTAFFVAASRLGATEARPLERSGSTAQVGDDLCVDVEIDALDAVTARARVGCARRASTGATPAPPTVPPPPASPVSPSPIPASAEPTAAQPRATPSPAAPPSPRDDPQGPAPPPPATPAGPPPRAPTRVAPSVSVPSSAAPTPPGAAFDPGLPPSAPNGWRELVADAIVDAVVALVQAALQVSEEVVAPTKASEGPSLPAPGGASLPGSASTGPAHPGAAPEGASARGLPAESSVAQERAGAVRPSELPTGRDSPATRSAPLRGGEPAPPCAISCDERGADAHATGGADDVAEGARAQSGLLERLIVAVRAYLASG